MHVDVHLADRQRDMKDAPGELALQQPVAVGLLHGGSQQLALDEPAVDKEQLASAGAVTSQRLGDKALHPHIAAAAADGQQAVGKVAAQRGVDGGQQLPVAGGVEDLLPVTQQLEGHIGMAQRQMGHNACGGGALGGILLHKLHAGGGVVEQVPHADGGAVGAAGFGDTGGHAALQVQRGAAVRTGLPGKNIHPRHGGDGGQRFAAEAQSADGGKVLGAAELAGGVAQEGGGQLLRRDAAAVVRNADVGQAALFQLGGNGGGTGVKSVFQKLLAHGGGAFHHLAGGDQVRQMGRQLLDLGHGMGPPFKGPAGRKGHKKRRILFPVYPRFFRFYTS